MSTELATPPDDLDAVLGGPYTQPVLPPVPRDVVAPSAEDPLVRRLSEVVGGPAGRRRAGSRTWWRALTVLVLVAAALMTGGVVQKQHCRTDGWEQPDFFFHFCYSDIGVLYASVGLGGDDRVTLAQAVGDDSGTTSLGESPVISAAMWAMAGVVTPDGAVSGPRRFFDLSAIALGCCLIAGVIALVRIGGRRPWDVAHLAMAPILPLTALIGYDLLAVALLCWGLWAWQRRRPLLAGLILGVAIDTRLIVAVVPIVLVTLAVRAGRHEAAGRFALGCVGAVLAVRFLLVPGWTGGLATAPITWRRQDAGFGSLWSIPQLLGDALRSSGVEWGPAGGLSAVVVTVCCVFGTVAVITGVVLFGITTQARPRVAHLALLAVIGCLLVGKSMAPQATLIILPLLALSGLRWRDHLIWASTEILYFGAVWLYIAGQSVGNRGLPAGFFLIFLVARLGGLIWIAVQTVRAATDPARDAVRAPLDGTTGDDDPQGGVLDGVRDALVVRFV